MLSRVVSVLLLFFGTAPVDIWQQTRNIILVNGNSVNAVGAINITSAPPSNTQGCGIVWAIAPNPAANRTDVSASINTACALTVATAQSGAPIFCASTNGTPAYTCSLAATRSLAAYSKGMSVLFQADTANTFGTASLNIDSVGIQSIKQADGTTDPVPGFFQPGQFHWLGYDGTVWRIVI